MSSTQTWSQFGTLTFPQADTAPSQASNPTVYTPSDQQTKPILRPASKPKLKVTGPGVLGGVGALGTVSPGHSSTGLISSLVNNPSGSLGGPIRELFASRLAGAKQGYNLRNSSIDLAAISKYNSSAQAPAGGAPIMIKPDITDYTDPGYVFFGYYD